ncbi:MAG TPA: transglutaminase family protein [Lacipirellulaceae bacterium]|nr:transglutaminase family protein [Lacipirellulaceae bacterium]
MKYQLIHRTWYSYSEPAPVCHNLVHLAPRSTPRQSCSHYRLRIDPRPAFLSRRDDYFGNLIEYFSIEGAHRRLDVIAESTVEVKPLATRPLEQSPPWEAVAAAARHTGDPLEPLETLKPLPWQLAFPSPRIGRSAELGAYAATSFPAGRPVVECLRDLQARIHRDFKFDTRATTVHTPIGDVLRLRSGVCQDFAHIAVGALRSVGLPGRYVSGYLRTTAPPGKPRLIGADASHAWASCWCGELGWVDFDPTNNCLVSDNHITTAWGRDYGDVCPIQGVFVGGGQHRMGVSVDVAPVEAA